MKDETIKIKSKGVKVEVIVTPIEDEDQDIKKESKKSGKQYLKG